MQDEAVFGEGADIGAVQDEIEGWVGFVDLVGGEVDDVGVELVLGEYGRLPIGHLKIIEKLGGVCPFGEIVGGGGEEGEEEENG